MSQEPKFEPGRAMFDAHYSAMPFTWDDVPESMRKLFADREGEIIRAFVSEVDRLCRIPGEPENFETGYRRAVLRVAGQYPEPPTRREG